MVIKMRTMITGFLDDKVIREQLKLDDGGISTHGFCLVNGVPDYGMLKPTMWHLKKWFDKGAFTRWGEPIFHSRALYAYPRPPTDGLITIMEKNKSKAKSMGIIWVDKYEYEFMQNERLHKYLPKRLKKYMEEIK